MIRCFTTSVLLCGITAVAQSPPSVPAVGLGILPPSAVLSVGDQTDRLIQSVQAQIKKSPDDFAKYDRLGTAYLQKARETGDLAYYELAEQTLKHSLELAQAGPVANAKVVDPLVHMALVYMGEHRFAEALLASHKAAAMGNGSLIAFAIAGDAYTDMGDYEDAAAAYKSLQTVGNAISLPLQVDYMADSRLAYLKFLHGDAVASIKLLQQSILAAMQIHVPAENLAWLYYELGERYFQAGDLSNAELAYNSGIATDANHYRSLAGLAKVRAAQQKFDESIRLYQASVAIVPFPQYIAELGDVYLKTGKALEAQQQYDLVEYIGYLSKLNRVLNNRELALFYADREIKLPQAIDLAKAELDVRRDVYTWDTLAWTYYKSRQLPDAEKTIQKALALHTQDSLILFHAGMIDHALGQDGAAEELLSRALQISPHFHIFYADEANRTLNAIARGRQARSSNEVH